MLVESLDNKEVFVICHTKDDLATLITHLDTDKYNITRIKAIGEHKSDIAEVCKKEKKLEIGG